MWALVSILVLTLTLDFQGQIKRDGSLSFLTMTKTFWWPRWGKNLSDSDRGGFRCWRAIYLGKQLLYPTAPPHPHHLPPTPHTHHHHHHQVKVKITKVICIFAVGAESILVDHWSTISSFPRKYIITHLMQRLEYSGRTASVPWLLLFIPTQRS